MKASRSLLTASFFTRGLSSTTTIQGDIFFTRSVTLADCLQTRSRKSPEHKAELEKKMAILSTFKRKELYEMERHSFECFSGKRFYSFEELDDYPIAQSSSARYLFWGLLGLRLFKKELKAIPNEVKAILLGHGSGDGNNPDSWIVSGKSAQQWADNLGPILISACEAPILRFAGTFHGRIIYPS